ncbi:TPA: hypothetical protein ACH3X3_001173 [Trebouxia sp. C0006]
MLALQHGTFRVLAQHAYGPSQEAKLLTPKTMKQRTRAGLHATMANMVLHTITGLLSLSAIQDASPAEVYTFTLQQLKDDSMRGLILNKVQEGIISTAQLAAKHVQCPAWSSGACSKGEACPYTHAIIPNPCHHYLKGKCNKRKSCRFSHGPWLPVIEQFLQSWAHGTDRKVQDGDA